MKKEAIGISVLMLVAIIWGFAFIAVDYALLNGWNTFTILFLRGFIAGLLLLPFAIKKRFWKDKKLITHSIIAGIFFFFGYGFQTLGQQKTSVVNSAFFTCLYVIFTPFIGLFFGRKEVTKKTIGATILAVVGIFFMSFISKGEFKLHFGDIFLILCAIFFALQIFWVGHFLDKDTDPISASSIMLLVMGLCSLILIPFSNETIPSSFKGFTGVLFAALFSSGVCSILQFYGQKYVNPSKSSLIMSLETPFACIFSFMLGFDKLNIYSIIGIIFMMSSIFLINFQYKKKYNFSKYKILLIDIDDTLLDFKAAEVYAFKKLLSSLNVEFKEEYLDKYSKDNLSLWKQYERGEIERKTIFEDRMKPLFKMLKLDADPVKASYLYLEYLSECSTILGNSYQELERLSKKYDLYIISNGEPIVQYPRIKASGIDKFFKGIYVSEEIGYQKPKKEFFDYVFNDIKNIDINDCCVIGDSLSSDILGAINYGIDSCWFNPNNKETELKITYVISDLSQIK